MKIYQKLTAQLFLMFIAYGVVFSQTPAISFVQGETLPIEKGKSDVYEIDLSSDAFDIVFPGKELHVCAGTSEELFKFAKPDTDINADFNSYFFIFKYLAGSTDTDHLSIEENTSSALNETHGAKPTGDGSTKYTVRSLVNDGDVKPLSAYKEFFMALWLDSNKDQYIDKEELLWVRAKIR